MRQIDPDVRYAAGSASNSDAEEQQWEQLLHEEIQEESQMRREVDGSDEMIDVDLSED